MAGSADAGLYPVALKRMHDIDKLKSNYLDIVDQLVENGGPSETQYSLYESVINHIYEISHGLTSNPEIVDEFREHLGSSLSHSTLQGLAFFKPRGYAGDFKIIDRIYQNWVSPDPDMEKWDKFFQSRLAPLAVRNRKNYLVDLVKKLSTKIPALQVLDVGCGPCRDIKECLETVEEDVQFTCVEMDSLAIDYARNLLGPVSDRIKFYQGHALKSDISEYFDLVWSGGLFDYFSDRIFVFGLKRLIKHVKPGGRLVVGNFSVNNPTQKYMEVVGDWFLNYRTEQQLIELAHKANLKFVDISVDKTEDGVNLFLILQTIEQPPTRQMA